MAAAILAKNAGGSDQRGHGVGMSLGVRSEGERVRGQSQLDSTQEGTGLRKDINIEPMGEALARMCNGPW